MYSPVYCDPFIHIRRKRDWHGTNNGSLLSLLMLWLLYSVLVGCLTAFDAKKLYFPGESKTKVYLILNEEETHKKVSLPL